MSGSLSLPDAGSKLQSSMEPNTEMAIEQEIADPVGGTKSEQQTMSMQRTLSDIYIGAARLLTAGSSQDTGNVQGATEDSESGMLLTTVSAMDLDEVHGSIENIEGGMLLTAVSSQELGVETGSSERSKNALLPATGPAEVIKEAYEGNEHYENLILSATRAAEELKEANGRNDSESQMLLMTRSAEEAYEAGSHSDIPSVTTGRYEHGPAGANGIYEQSTSAMTQTRGSPMELEEAHTANQMSDKVMLFRARPEQELQQAHGENISRGDEAEQELDGAHGSNEQRENAMLLGLGPAQGAEGSPGAIIQLGSQDPDRTRRLASVSSAVVAALSTLSVALVSLQQLLGLLGLIPGMGPEELSSGRSIDVRESSCLHYWRSWRNFNDAQDILRLLQFMLLIRRRSADVPKQMSSPWYIKPRSVQWFVYFIDSIPREDPERFMQYFHVSPDLFYHICELVSDQMLTDPPSALRVLPNRVLGVERQVALALRRLATGDQFLGIAELFGVSKSTAVKVTWKFIQALNHKGKHFLMWPQGERLQQVKDGFKNAWGFPNCCGAVGRTYFTVEFPRGEDTAAYYDYKHHVSAAMQAIVDQDLRFLDVVAGWPGGIQDSRLLHKSKFFRTSVYRENRLNGTEHRGTNGAMLKEYIIGDAGYPLYEWLIVPYPKGSSAPMDEFNVVHSSARMCVERAFSRLKGTWRILSRILWKPRKERIGPMITACCILHNLIIDQHDTLNPQVYEGVNPRPGGYESVAIPTRVFFEGGPEARDVIFGEVMRTLQ